MAYTRRSYLNIVAEIQRMPGLQDVGLSLVLNTLDTAVKDICGQPWPWNYAETNIAVLPAYTTGTVSITDQTNIVTGLGTTWLTTWPQGARIQMSGSSTDYIISSIGGATTLTLAQNVNIGKNLTSVTYTLYWDTFQYPQNYIPGSDVGLFNMANMYRVPKVPRYRFEQMMNAGNRNFFSTLPQFYCDTGLDTSASGTGQFQFRIGSPTTGTAEYRLCYHAYPGDASASATAYVPLPPGADEILTLVTAAKLYDQFKMPGESAQMKALAEGKIRLLKRAVNTQTIDDIPQMSTEVPDSSISQWGLSIQRM